MVTQVKNKDGGRGCVLSKRSILLAIFFGNFKPSMQKYLFPQQSSIAQVTEDQKRHIAETFYNADEEKKGFLNAEDLKVAFVALFGYKPTRNEVEQLMETSRTKGIPGMSFDTFAEIAKTKLLAQDVDDEIRQMFIVFDTKCCGFITLDVAKKVFLQVAPFLDSVTIEKIFREADTDRDGRVSYRDFEFVMKYKIDESL